MRFREKDADITSRSYNAAWYQYGAKVYDDDYLCTRVIRHRRMLDVVTPGFSVLRNKGSIICSPMLAEEVYLDTDYTIGIFEGTENGRGPIINRTWTTLGLQVSAPSMILPDGSHTAMDNAYKQFSRETELAIMRAHADVDISEMAILATAGELPETLRWILSIIERVRKLSKIFRGKFEVSNTLRKLRYSADESVDMKDLKRLESYMSVLAKRKARRLELSKDDSSIVDAWLEYRYAIRPLIFDLRNALSALEKVIVAQRLTARGRELSKGEDTSSFSFTAANNNSISVVGTISTKEQILARAGCLYYVDATLTSFLDIIGLDQPLESGYELIPFSFVLDWVFSVGDWLNGIFKSSGLSILTSWVTLSVERTENRKITSASIKTGPGYSWTDQQFVLGSSHSVVKWKWRVPNPDFPALPRFDLKLNLAKIIDLGAIARNTISGKSTVVARRNNHVRFNYHPRTAKWRYPGR